MRAIKAAAGIAMALSALFVLCSCEKSGAKLVGEWERDRRGSSYPIYIISEDGTWSERFRSGFTATKEWSVDKDYTEITFVNEYGNTATGSITNLEDDSFTLAFGDDSTTYYRLS